MIVHVFPRVSHLCALQELLLHVRAQDRNNKMCFLPAQFVTVYAIKGAQVLQTPQATDRAITRSL